MRRTDIQGVLKKERNKENFEKKSCLSKIDVVHEVRVR